MDRIVIASGNQGKIREFRQLFSKYGIETIAMNDLDETLPDVEETGETFEENARLKAETISDIIQVPVLADDSGLEVDALNKRPGVYSARFAGEQKDDQANLQKVLNELKGKEDREARFVCVLALARPGKETVYKRGTCEGQIGLEPQGENGFGYDPVFYPKGFNRTMAQLSSDEKNSISHRSNALKQLEGWLSQSE
ncbi:XTP/dITP diphosphatase [Pontibacillus marinus]|uniref:dITP/XTP pyrophosphatase n=1 Tax=Pontibacillus marinus BH030004 = DSM 16465 TaxID=1385511 RepID=A0A0A5GA59_9BACI|nr:XTP/dITP diphosphatase [Pontibacillus marinus]KGX88073.1 deoxyribonucleotide triphosphate pyrophosphatase [Pontibacillus marinus BH030004 = DSM 16465]